MKVGRWMNLTGIEDYEYIGHIREKEFDSNMQLASLEL